MLGFRILDRWLASSSRREHQALAGCLRRHLQGAPGGDRGEGGEAGQEIVRPLSLVALREMKGETI